MFKIFFFENLCEIGLCIKKLNLGFFETGTLAVSVSIAGILAFAAEIMRSQVIGRKAVCLKKRDSLFGKCGDFLTQFFNRSRLSEQQGTSLAGTQRCHFLVDRQKSWNFGICFPAPFLQGTLYLRLTTAVFSHDGIILKIL